MPTIYICGPMTGLPEYNYPAFHRAAAELRALNWTVENPAEGESLPSWNAYVRRGIAALVSRCDAIYLLPGWSQSKGAKAELRVARDLSIPMMLCPGAEVPAVEHETGVDFDALKRQPHGAPA